MNRIRTTLAAADYDGRHFPNDTIGGKEGLGTQNHECHSYTKT